MLSLHMRAPKHRGQDTATFRSTSSITAKLSNYKRPAVISFQEHPTSANQVSGDVCLHPTCHPFDCWRRWLSPGLAGKPATKRFGSRWQHTVTGETELNARSRVSPAQPGSKTRLGRAGSATPPYMPSTQGSTQRRWLPPLGNVSSDCFKA